MKIQYFKLYEVGEGDGDRGEHVGGEVEFNKVKALADC
jgi:hypothetical protein